MAEIDPFGSNFMNYEKMPWHQKHRYQEFRQV